MAYSEFIRLTSINVFQSTASKGLVFVLVTWTLGLANASAADRCTARKGQQASADQGYEPGLIDGAIGRRTHNAIQAFQQANDMPASGRLNRDTCRQFTSPPEPQASETSKAKPAPGQPALSNEATPSAPAPDAQQAAPETPSSETETQASDGGTTAPATENAAPNPSFTRIDDPIALYGTAFGLHKSRSYHFAVSAFEHYLRTFGDHDRVADALYWLSEGYLEIGMEQEARSRLDGISPAT